MLSAIVVQVVANVRVGTSVASGDLQERTDDAHRPGTSSELAIDSSTIHVAQQDVRVAYIGDVVDW